MEHVARVAGGGTSDTNMGKEVLIALKNVFYCAKKSCTGSLCAHMHGSVLPVPVLCLRILPMVRDKSISFGRLWVAINISKGFGRFWVAIDLLSKGGDNLAVLGYSCIGYGIR